MPEHETIEPEYHGTVGGQYSTEEHLKAQQTQISPQTGKPLHEPAEVEPPAEVEETAPDPGAGNTGTPPVGGDLLGGSALGAP